MAKTMEEFQKVLNDIRSNLDDTAKVTELLDNDNLRNVNMDLFLKVGNQRAESQSQENQSQENQPKENKLSFDNLFDEYGNLK